MRWDLPETIHNAPDAKALPMVKGNVRFNNVSFSYNPGEQVLNNVSFDVKPGEMIAFVGPSGAGKSTVASLLPRFYDVTDGSITIDGEDIRRVTLQSLREQVGIVPQETVLFNGSVYDNILYGRLDATKEEVEAAAKAANAHTFITELPDHSFFIGVQFHPEFTSSPRFGHPLFNKFIEAAAKYHKEHEKAE